MTFLIHSPQYRTKTFGHLSKMLFAHITDFVRATIVYLCMSTIMSSVSISCSGGSPILWMIIADL